MCQSEQLRIFLIAGILISSLGADECIYQECQCDAPNIMCDSLHLTSLPALHATQQSDFTSLSLDTNEITTIPARSLPANLTQIVLEANPITTINDAAFDDSALTLTSLSFSSAMFSRIPDAFLHLHALSKLIIEDTNITDWNPNAMKNIGQTLNLFYLSQHSLTMWPDSFQYFTQLTTLTITDTSIAMIPDDALDNVANSLTSLGLFNNMLKAVPKALSKLTLLEELLLSENKIVDITWLPVTAKIRSLALGNNRISDSTQLSKTVSGYAQSLNDFGIGGNRLTVIPDLSFLENIQRLYLTDNQINDPYSGSLPVNIYVLSFANNSFPAIPSIVLTLKYVTELHLNFNRIPNLIGSEIPQWINMIEVDNNFITELTDTSFPEKSVLTSLSLNYNPVSRISSSAFKNVPALLQLTMKGSKLTRVPLAFTSLVNINFLDISDSVNLVCTCMEKDVGPWIQRFANYIMNGNCGDISVYFFFTSLSPSCPSN